MCGAGFWSWEHFLSCPFVPVRVSVPEFIAMISLSAWVEIADHVIRVSRVWLSLFDEEELLIKPSDLVDRCD
jgi:hypothetical protein